MEFTLAPILAHVDPKKPFFIEADASDFALGSILSQQGDDENYILWPSTRASLTPPKSTTRYMTVS